MAKRTLESAADLLPNPVNSAVRTMSDEARQALRASLEAFGDISGIVWNKRTGHLLGGHRRIEELEQLGAEFMVDEEQGPRFELEEWRWPVRVVDVPLKRERAILATANNEHNHGTWIPGVNALVDELLPEFPGLLLERLKIAETPYQLPDNGEPTSMSETFGAPPFSVLDARQGYWRDRKDEWKNLGCFSEDGRADATIGQANPDGCLYGATNAGVSVIDPVLCELMYAWFCPAGGQVVNPTAGESVYGIVAGVMGYRYHGVELRTEQIETNERQADLAEEWIKEQPVWVHGNGEQVAELSPPADMIMCCPPYYDLEQYSELEQDLSHMASYAEFRESYRRIIRGCAKVLKPNRFAVFVVGEIRDKRGHYRNFVGDTVAAFMDAGMAFYNEAILVDPVGSLKFRAGRVMRTTRKLGKAHQNVLVFLKGDPKLATEACGEVTRVDLSDAETET